MTRGILIAGNDSALSRALEAEAAKRVERFAVALIPNRFAAAPQRVSAAPETPEEKARIPLDWNPGSSISARTLVLSAENRLEHIDEAILICSPPSIRRAAAGLPLSDVEILINDHIKGWFFLVKEITSVFTNRKRGTLALVYNEISPGGGREEAADLLGPSAAASFRALTGSLLAAAKNEPYLTMGFSGAEAGDEAGFAAFVLKTLDEGNSKSSGKLNKYGKFSFFR
ncbi:MAG: hypothetical protein FWG99_06175 [Treponema sp.]|nr:hypothetical protein [Treponema sp.]